MSLFGWKIKSSEKIIRAAFSKFDAKLALFWSGGKDSTVLLHLTRSLNQEKVPIRVLFIDTGLYQPQRYASINTLVTRWNIRLITLKDKGGLRRYRQEKNRMKKQEIITLMKIRCLKKAVKNYRLQGLLVGIRWDENEAFAKEAYFSKRSTHTRIQPLLHFSEADIDTYIREFGIPVFETAPLLDRKPKTMSRGKEKITPRLRAKGYF